MPTFARVTQSGAIVGTPAYMAPEQLNGQEVDPRTDVFAFGVLMYEYACGAHPFDAPSMLARAGRVLGTDPDSVTRHRLDLPPAFIAVVERCLRKNPAERFASAERHRRGARPGDDRSCRRRRYGITPGGASTSSW